MVPHGAAPPAQGPDPPIGSLQTLVILAAGIVSVAAVPVPAVDLGDAGVQQRGGLALLHREEGEREEINEFIKWNKEQGAVFTSAGYSRTLVDCTHAWPV